jgi:hypothetical protein
MATVTYLNRSWSRPAWLVLLGLGLLFLGVYFWNQRLVRLGEASAQGLTVSLTDSAPSVLLAPIGPETGG